MLPDPEFDPVCAIFYSILNDVPEMDERKIHGILVLDRSLQQQPASPQPSTSTMATPPLGESSYIWTSKYQF